MTSNIHSPRIPSIFSSEYKEDYAIRVQYESNNIIEDNPITMTNSP